MKRYPTYKDSRIDWIGDIPKHWVTNKLKFFSVIVNGSTPKSETTEYWDGDIVWITPEDLGRLQGKIITDSSRKITEIGLNSCGSTLTPMNSIILSTRAPIGHLGVTEVETCTNQGCKTIVPDLSKCRSHYLYYSLFSSKEILQSLGQGSTFIELASYRLKDFKIPFLDLDEQGCISKFLDSKTNQIDTLIEKKQKMIELLKEERTAIINHAVTKGLNSDVQMKDSGIKWLGEIPEHWQLIQLGFKSKMIVPMRDKPTRFNGDIPWIRIEDLQGKYVEDSTSEQRVSEDLVKEMNLKIYPKGTVLCSCSCNMGVTAIVKKPLISNQTFIGIVPDNELLSEFLYYSMNANSDRLQYLGSGAIQQYLSRESFEKLKIPIPPYVEQKTIVDYLDLKTHQIDILIEKENKSIVLLQEYRATLISEVVTGKIDVRDEVCA